MVRRNPEIDGVESARLWHGALFGMVATVVASVVPIGALALGIWPAPGSITANVFGMLLGMQANSAMALILAGLWQLMYGALWGAVLAFVTGPFDAPVLARPSTVSYGIGVGFLRWLVVNIGALVPLRWGPFGLLENPMIPVATLAMDLLFGVTAAWLLARDEMGRLHVPRLQPLTRFRA
jgi:hypothetical protein